MGAQETLTTPMIFADLSIKDRQEIIRRVQAENGLHLQIIEKDWWVTAVLRALFALPYAEHISFKGGTNLSKCWHLISRMSEDADIAIDREYLGFSGKLSKTQISDKLRRASCAFVRNRLQYDLAEQLVRDGINKDTFTVSVNITPVTTTDPEIIEVAYHPAFDKSVPYYRNALSLKKCSCCTRSLSSRKRTCVPNVCQGTYTTSVKSWTRPLWRKPCRTRPYISRSSTIAAHLLAYEGSTMTPYNLPPCR